VNRPGWLGVLIVLLAATLFGSLGVASRWAYDAGVTPLAFVAWRATFGAIGLWLLVLAFRRPSGIRSAYAGLGGRGWRWLLLAVGLAAGVNATTFMAFDLTTVALALLGFYTYPAMVAVGVVLAGREPPSVAWRADPGWQSLFRAIPLRNLSPEESRSFLAHWDIPTGDYQSLLDFTHGHPLALSLVADVFAQRGELRFDPKSAPDVVQALLQQFVQQHPRRNRRCDRNRSAGGHPVHVTERPEWYGWSRLVPTAADRFQIPIRWR